MEDKQVKKIILSCMLVGLLSGVCFAQRGGARSAGSMGPSVRMAPEARPLPNARNVGPAIGNTGSRNVGPTVGNTGANGNAGVNVGPGTHAQTVGPNAQTVSPNARPQTEVKPMSPGANATDNSGVGPKATTVSPDAIADPDAARIPR